MEQNLKKPEGVTQEDLDIGMNAWISHLETLYPGKTPEEIEWIAHTLAIDILAAHHNGEATY